MCKKPKYLINNKIKFSKDYLISLPVVNQKKEIIKFYLSKITKRKKKEYNFSHGRRER